MNIKLVLVCTLVFTFVFSSLQQNTPSSTLGANCVLIKDMPNAIFEYSQNATHLVAQVRVASLGNDYWLGLGMGISSGSLMGTPSNPLTIYVAFKSGSSISFNEYSATMTSTPSAIVSNYASNTEVTTSNGVTTFTVVRTVARPVGAPANYFTVPTSGSYDLVVAYSTGSSAFSKHTMAKKIQVSTAESKNTCVAPQPSISTMMPMISAPKPVASIPMPPSGSDFGATSCIPVPSSGNNAFFFYKSNATHILASVIVNNLGAASWLALGFDSVNNTGMSSGTIYFGGVNASANVMYREGLLSNTALPPNIGQFADQISLQSAEGLTALSVLRPFMAPANAPAGYISLNSTLNSILIAYKNESTFTNTIASHSFAKRFTVSLSQVQDTCRNTPRSSSTSGKPVSSSFRVEIAEVLLILVLTLVF